MKTVVLLSTHNGEDFIAEQVRSILDQDWPDLHVVIRDDGSRDRTRDILDHLAADRRITLVHEPNIGLPHAFFRLVHLCPADAELVLFADQDDVWQPGKIAAAAAALGRIESGKPGLYCSRLRIVDRDLRPVGLSPNWPRPPAFGNALVENICTGCTAALNASAFELLAANRPTGGVIHHDWWLYLLVSAFGTVIFDPEPRVFYRMHGSNAVGLPTGQLDNLRRRFGRLRDGGSIRLLLDQARALEQMRCDTLPIPARKRLIEFLAIAGDRRAAAGLARNPLIFRQKRGDDLVWRAGLLMFAAGLIGT